MISFFYGLKSISLGVSAAIILSLVSCSKGAGNDSSGGNSKPAYTVDASGNYTSPNGQGATVIRMQKDKKIVAMGYGWFVRLQSDGVTLDNSFSVPAELNTASAAFKVRSFTLQDDGKILVFGTFVLLSGRKAIVRLNADGSLDNSFNNPVLDINYYRQSIGINEVQELASGKLIIAGAFSYKVGTVYGYAIARLNKDQSIDPSFVSPVSADEPFGVTHMQPFSDGSFLLLGYGAIKLKNGYNYNVVKIGADGVYDNAYVLNDNYGTMAALPGYPTAVALQGLKMLIGGGFKSIGTKVYNGLVRLNTDGSVDKSFMPPTLGYEDVNAILVLPNNYLLIGRNASLIFSETADYVNYCNPDGITDTSFHMQYIPGGVQNMLSLDETTVLLAGSFTVGTKRYALIRLKKS